MEDKTDSLAKLFMDGECQVVRRPKGVRLRGDAARVHQAERGLLLEPRFIDRDVWFAELHRLSDPDFMPEGRQQPPMPDDDEELTF